MKHLLFYITLTTLLFGCVEEGEEAAAPEPPYSQFEEPIKKHPINLEHRIGKTIELKRYNDTIVYNISYDKKTKRNSIIKGEKDTIFTGSVNKLNHLFLMNSELENGNFRIFAIELTDSTITDLETEWGQGYLIDELIESKELKDGLIDSISFYLLNPKKKQAKYIFNHLVNNTVKRKIVVHNLSDYINEPISIDTIASQELNDLEISVYPNPFIDKLNIENPYSLIVSKYFIRDFNGDIQKEGTLNEGLNELDVSNLEPNNYVISFSNNGQRILIIKK